MSHHDEPPLPRNLQLIAARFGIPVEAFLGRRGKVDGFIDARECMRLWSSIYSEGGRERVLAFMRGVVNDERR